MKNLKKQPIFLKVNNGGTMVIKQSEYDGTIDATIWEPAPDGTNDIRDCLVISPGDMVMLINYYRNCKAGIEKSEYIK